MEQPAPGVSTGDIRPELRTLGVIRRVDGTPLQTADIALTAGWGHAGLNGAVMPGQGKVIERDYTRDELDEIRRGVETLGLTVSEALELLGDRTCDVHLNDTAYWSNVPRGVWEYVLGGYQVLKKWLSYREERLLGRPLGADEIRQVTVIVRRIAAILEMQRKLDADYHAAIADRYSWPNRAP